LLSEGVDNGVVGISVYISRLQIKIPYFTLWILES